MAGRKKKRKRKPRAASVVVAADPDRLTSAQYHEAWHLFAAGTTPKQIRRIMGLTGAQLHRLYSEGLPPKGGRRTALVGFEQRLAEETAAIRSEAVAAGKMLSTRAVTVLEKTMKNSDTAQTLIDQIFRMTADKIAHALTQPVDKRPTVSELMPSAHTLQVLRTLRQVGRGFRDAAQTFRTIYDDPPAVHPATRSALNLTGQRGAQPALPGAGGDTVPAALAFLDGAVGDGASTAMLADMAQEMQRWTPEQLAHYADTGEEPAPTDVIDVEASTIAPP